MKKKSLRNSLLLLLTAVIWGSAFVAQSTGMEHVDAFTFNASRSFIAVLVLLPYLLIMSRIRRKLGFQPVDAKGKTISARDYRRNSVLGGILCGILLCAATNFQQFGIIYTTVGKAGFITALYVVLVPILGLFLRRKTTLLIWISVGLSVIGLYLLCMTGSISLQLGDSLVLICALIFSFHIMTIDYFTVKADGVLISCIQFLVSGIISAILMLIFEEPSWSAILSAGGSILYTGVLSSGVAYTLQIVGQRDVNPTVASLILCLESVVSALAGWIILGERLNSRELSGCLLMFSAIILAQLPMPKKTLR